MSTATGSHDDFPRPPPDAWSDRLLRIWWLLFPPIPPAHQRQAELTVEELRAWFRLRYLMI